MADRDYMLESTDSERARLRRQGEMMRPFTERLFRNAGIGEGMAVLDVGCGAGDVSLIAADLIGPTGRLVGFDRDPAQVAEADRRLGDAGATFVVATIDDPPEGVFDAIVGRLVLMYQADLVAAIRSLAERLRPGGVMAFVESNNRHDVNGAMQWPIPTPLQQNVSDWIQLAFSTAGAQIYTGLRLPSVFRAAGLEPQAPYETVGPVYEGRASCEMTAGIVRAMLPVLARAGVDTDAIGIDTLAERIYAETGDDRVVCLPMTAVWARKPS